MGADIDLRKRLQDQANELVNKAKRMSPMLQDPMLEQFLKDIIFMSLKQGYIWGVTSQMQVADMMLKDLQGIELTEQKQGGPK